MKIVILHDEILPTSRPDEVDALVQAEVVRAALAELGHESTALQFSLDLRGVGAALNRLGAEVVFNLVESAEGHGRLIYLAPALLDVLGLPYTGASTDAMFLTSNKLLTKRLLEADGIDTPPWVASASPPDPEALFPGRYIVKAVWEEASVGIDDDTIVEAADRGTLVRRIEAAAGRMGGEAFAELYIDGREFNLALLTSPDGPVVLPPAEIHFVDYPAGKPRIVSYRAKWDADSFEYHNTPHCFDFPAADRGLLDELRRLARRCWDVFGLRGYARVDFRVDSAGRPWVLELNANPCLSPDAGFLAAAQRDGFRMVNIVDQLLADALGRSKQETPIEPTDCRGHEPRP